MHTHKTLYFCALGLLASCTELTPLGVSGELSSIRDDARHLTTLVVPSDQRLQPNTKLGDIDGDGLDDLIVGVHDRVVGPAGAPVNMTAYLFYGRADLPEQLSLADADATFESGFQESTSLGDVNGDKLSDFVLGDETGIEIVFGSATRLSGHHPKFTTGHKWSYVGPSDGGLLTLGIMSVYGLGDINGDGADDFLIRAYVEDTSSTGEPWYEAKDFVMEGRAGAWPTGTWAPSWAAAKLGADAPEGSPLTNVRSADLDGDGYRDLIATSEFRVWLFYGGPAGLHGTLTPSQADAELPAAGQTPGSPSGPYIAYSFLNIDGDAADDIVLRSAADTQVMYGSPARLSGVVTFQADLTFTGQDAHIVSGDFNADGQTDLLVNAGPSAARFPRAMYELRGTGTRLTGSKLFQPGEAYQPVGYTPPDLTRSDFNNHGDIDGDGSDDIAAFQYPETLIESEPPEVTLFLLPGSTPAPD